MQARSMRQFAVTVAAGLLLELLKVTAVAAAPNQDDTTKSESLGEIIVTARKREESIQNVPSSVVAISAERLQADAVKTLADLAAIAPGVNLNGYEPNKATVSIRGVTSTNAGVGGFSPTVGFFLDDVALETVNHDLGGQVEPPFFDLERVEVLKGPQGTLYGGSAMGGAIKFISASPAIDKSELKMGGGTGFTQAGAESYQASAIANVPLIAEHLAARVGVYYDYAGGYIDRTPHGYTVASESTPPNPSTFTSPNTVAERDVNAYTTKAARLALGIAPSADLTIKADSIFQQTTSGDTSDFQPNLGLRQSFVTNQPTVDQLAIGILSITRSLKDFDIISVSSFADARDTLKRDLTFFVGGLVPSFAALPSPDFEGARNDTYSQEVRLSSTHADSPLQYVGGMYFRRQSTQTYQDVYTLGSGVSEPGIPSNLVYEDIYHFSVRQLAAFGEMTYAIRSLSFTAGARVYNFHVGSSKTGDGLFNGGPVSNVTAGTNTGISPKVEVAFHPSEAHLLYALADKGFRPGGANTAGPLPSACGTDLAALGLSAAPSTFKPDSLWNYELGSKNTLAEGRATLNAAVFYMDWRDIQQGVTLPCGFGFTANLGAAVSKGAEAEIRFRPVAGLELGGSVTYDDAYVSRAAPNTGISEGDPIQQAPKWSGNAVLDYSLPVASGRSLFTHSEYQYRGSLVQGGPQSISSSVDPLSGAPLGAVATVPNPAYLSRSYHLVNASVGLRASRWTIRALAQNLTDVHPLLNLSAAGPGLPFYTPTFRPRTLSLRFDFEF
jgi:iron complex outermembrane receptor protein